MTFVKSEKIFTPMEYLEYITRGELLKRATLSKVLTSNYLPAKYDDKYDTLKTLMNCIKCEFWDYPLSEIDHIIENKINVVLVKCSIPNSKNGELEESVRWFEVPET